MIFSRRPIRLALALLLAAAPNVRGDVAAPRKLSISSVEASQDAKLTEALWLMLRSLPKDRRPKVALVLGGGGARGLAHIGVLEVLEREKVPVDLVVGTSVGAVVGALYAAGLPVEKIKKMSREIGWDKLSDLSGAKLVELLVTEQLLSSKNMERYVESYIGDKKFADLSKSFACVAADLKTGEQIILREGSVSLAARASATMPGIFQPVPYRHRLLIDGGVVDNVPTDVAKLMGADVILCVNTPADFSKNQPSNVFMTLTQALYIQGEVITKERLSLADVVIWPKVGDVATHQLWRQKECVDAGYAAAIAALPNIRRTLTEKFLRNWLAEARAPQKLDDEGGRP